MQYRREKSGKWKDVRIGRMKCKAEVVKMMAQKAVEHDASCARDRSVLSDAT